MACWFSGVLATQYRVLERDAGASGGDLQGVVATVGNTAQPQSLDGVMELQPRNLGGVLGEGEGEAQELGQRLKKALAVLQVERRTSSFMDWTLTCVCVCVCMCVCACVRVLGCWCSC